MKAISVLLLLCFCCLSVSADVTEALERACDRNDYAAFVKSAREVPDDDVCLGKMLLYAIDGLCFTNDPIRYDINPMTRQRIVEYLLSRGVGNTPLPPVKPDPQAYYKHEMPAAVLAVYKAVLNREFYAVALIAAHFDMRPYINERLLPHQTTLLYLAAERDAMRTVQVLLLCGADESLRPAGRPPIPELLRHKMSRDAWESLMRARRAQQFNDQRDGRNRPRYY